LLLAAGLVSEGQRQEGGGKGSLICRMEGSHREEGFQRRRDANFLLNSGELLSPCCSGLAILNLIRVSTLKVRTGWFGHLLWEENELIGQRDGYINRRDA